MHEVVKQTNKQKITRRADGFNKFLLALIISNNITGSQFASLHFQIYLIGTYFDGLVLGHPLNFCICLYPGKQKITLLNFKTSA